MWSVAMWALAASSYVGTRGLTTSCGALEDWYTDTESNGQNSCCLVDGERNHSVSLQVPYAEHALFEFNGVNRSTFPSVTVDHEELWDETNTTLFLTVTDITQTQTFVNSLIVAPFPNVGGHYSSDTSYLFNYLIASEHENVGPKIHLFVSEDRDMSNPTILAGFSSGFVRVYRI